MLFTYHAPPLCCYHPSSPPPSLAYPSKPTRTHTHTDTPDAYLSKLQSSKLLISGMSMGGMLACRLSQRLMDKDQATRNMLPGTPNLKGHDLDATWYRAEVAPNR